MPYSLLVTLTASFVLTGDASRDDPSRAEKESLEGTWKVVSFDRDGPPVVAEEAQKLRVIITADKLTLKQGDKGRDAFYILDPSRRPKTIDLIVPDSPLKEKPWPGIYELEGDDLKICWPFQPDKVRPTAFAARAGSGLYLLTLKRVKQ